MVEYHGDQRIQVAKRNLTVPAPRDLDAEVNIEVTEDKVEVAETEDEDEATDTDGLAQINALTLARAGQKS